MFNSLAPDRYDSNFINQIYKYIWFKYNLPVDYMSIIYKNITCYVLNWHLYYNEIQLYNCTLRNNLGEIWGPMS